jgi:hypothetical protein
MSLSSSRFLTLAKLADAIGGAKIMTFAML